MANDFEMERNGNSWMGWVREVPPSGSGRQTYTGVGNLTEGDEVTLFTNFDPANFSIVGINLTRISDEDCEDAAI